MSHQQHIVEKLTALFLSFDEKVSLKFWYDDEQQLKFFLTNAPPRQKPPDKNPTEVNHETPASSPVIQTRTRKRRRQVTTPEVPRNNENAVCLNVTTIEDDRDERDNDQDDCDICDDEITESNIPVTNKFNILQSDLIKDLEFETEHHILDYNDEEHHRTKQAKPDDPKHHVQMRICSHYACKKPVEQSHHFLCPECFRLHYR